jgi:hypothetical protein
LRDLLIDPFSSELAATAPANINTAMPQKYQRQAPAAALRTQGLQRSMIWS